MSTKRTLDKAIRACDSYFPCRRYYPRSERKEAEKELSKIKPLITKGGVFNITIHGEEYCVVSVEVPENEKAEKFYKEVVKKSKGKWQAPMTMEFFKYTPKNSTAYGGGWRVEAYNKNNRSKRKIVKANSKHDAAMKRRALLREFDEADVYEGNDYIDPTEL